MIVYTCDASEREVVMAKYKVTPHFKPNGEMGVNSDSDPVPL